MNDDDNYVLDATRTPPGSLSENGEGFEGSSRQQHGPHLYPVWAMGAWVAAQQPQIEVLTSASPPRSPEAEARVAVLVIARGELSTGASCGSLRPLRRAGGFLRVPETT